MSFRTRYVSMQWPHPEALRMAEQYQHRPTMRFGAFEIPLDADESELGAVLAEAYGLNVLARSLSRISRFNGHAGAAFCSVAQHSVLVMAIARTLFPDDLETARLALYHDAHEAIVGDVPSPIKRVIGAPWRDFEDRVERALRGVLGLTSKPVSGDRVKIADAVALRVEDARWRSNRSTEQAAEIVAKALSHYGSDGTGSSRRVPTRPGPAASSAAVRDLIDRDRRPEDAEGLFLAAAAGIE